MFNWWFLALMPMFMPVHTGNHWDGLPAPVIISEHPSLARCKLASRSVQLMGYDWAAVCMMQPVGGHYNTYCGGLASETSECIKMNKILTEAGLPRLE